MDDEESGDMIRNVCEPLWSAQLPSLKPAAPQTYFFCRVHRIFVVLPLREAVLLSRPLSLRNPLLKTHSLRGTSKPRPPVRIRSFFECCPVLLAAC